MRKSILLVDDSSSIRTMTRMYLESQGSVEVCGEAPMGTDSPVLKRRDGGADGLAGVVTLVRCAGDEMEVTVKANSQPAPVVFHTKDRNKVTYASNISAIHGDIEPCNELKGHMVVAGFHAPLAKSYYGELDSITVVK